MTATLTLEQEKEIAERTRQDPKVIMSFYELYERYRRQEQNDATACELALRRQQEVYEAMYQHKRAEHMALLRQNYRDQVLQRKRQRTGPGFWTKNGLQVRSKIEKIIADFLREKGLRFVYEPILNLEGYYVMPDFYLYDFGVFLEHFGLETPAYRQSAELKLKRYRRLRLSVVCTHAGEEPEIEQVLTRKLREAGVVI